MNFTTIKRFVRQNAPAIFTGIGCLGVVGTGILAYKAGKNPNNKKMLIPPIVVGGATIVAIILSASISSTIIMGLSATGGYVLLNRKRVEDEIAKVYGRDKLNEVKRNVTNLLGAEFGEIYKNNGYTFEQSKFGGNQLCFDGYGGRIFRADPQVVEDGVEALISDFDHGNSVGLNDLYSLWGIQETGFGDDWGWPADPEYYDGPICIEVEMFEHPENYENLEGFKEPVLMVNFYTSPMYEWHKYKY